MKLCTHRWSPILCGFITNLYTKETKDFFVTINGRLSKKDSNGIQVQFKSHAECLEHRRQQIDLEESILKEEINKKVRERMAVILELNKLGIPQHKES